MEGLLSMEPTPSSLGEGHPNCITGSRVTEILLNGWVLPVGGVALGRVYAAACAAGLFPSVYQVFVYLSFVM